VMLTDGSELGTVSNIIIDMKNGELIDLVTRPNPRVDTSKYRTEDGLILVSFDAVKAAKEYALVDKKAAMEKI